MHNRNINSDLFPLNKRSGSYNKNLSQNADPKSPDSNSLKVSQKLTGIMFHLDDAKNRCKSALIQFHKNYLKIHKFSQDVFAQLEGIDQANSLNQMFEHLFNILKCIWSKEKIEQYQKRAKEQSTGFIITIQARQAKKIKIFKDEPAHKTKISKRIQDLQSALSQTKTELFALKEQKSYLEKKIISIIQDYTMRKKNYWAEIKKLTGILNLSTMDIRQLVLEKTFVKQQRPTTNEIQRHISIPFFQPTDHQDQVTNNNGNNKRWNGANGSSADKRNGLKGQGQYNVQFKLRSNKLESVQSMQENGNQIGYE